MSSSSHPWLFKSAESWDQRAKLRGHACADVLTGQGSHQSSLATFQKVWPSLALIRVSHPLGEPIWGKGLLSRWAALSCGSAGARDQSPELRMWSPQDNSHLEAHPDVNNLLKNLLPRSRGETRSSAESRRQDGELDVSFCRNSWAPRKGIGSGGRKCLSGRALACQWAWAALVGLLTPNFVEKQHW